MVIPFPMSMPIGMGPSAYAQSKKWLVITLLVFQAICAQTRLADPVGQPDVFGWFFLCIAVGLGCYAVYKEMDMQFLVYWGAACAYNGLMQLLQTLQASLSGRQFLAAGYPWWLNIFGFFFILTPWTSIFGAIMSYHLYKNVDADCGPGTSSPPGGSYFTSAPQETTYLIAGEPVRTVGAAPSFTAFSGQGQRLGSPGGPRAEV